MDERDSKYLFNYGLTAGWLGVGMYLASGNTVVGWMSYTIGCIMCLYVIVRGFLHDWLGIG